MLRLEIKGLDDSTGTIEGYGSVKQSVDSYGDKIAHGAYGDLSGFIQSGFLAEGHDWDCAPIGYIMDAKEDGYGLWFKAQFHSTDNAQSVRTVVRERMDAGKDVGLSIGFFTKDAEYATEDGKQVRVLKSIDIKEISIVTVPAMPLAVAAAVKGGGIPYHEQEEGVLAALTDWVGRLSTFAGERKQGLTEEKLTALRAAQDRISDLLAVATPDPVVKLADPADVAAMTALYNKLQG